MTFSNDAILTLLRKCNHLEKLIIEPENSWAGERYETDSMYRKMHLFMMHLSQAYHIHIPELSL